MNTRPQATRRASVACLTGLLLSSIILNLGLHALTQILQRSQDATRRSFKRFDSSLTEYHDQHGNYPKLLSKVAEYADGSPRDGWGWPMRYASHGDNYVVTSYGADHEPGGTGMDCDLSNLNPAPLQAQPTLHQVLVTPLSRPFEIGALVCGLLTALLTFGSIKDNDVTGVGWILLLFKVAVILVAAFCVSSVITIADIPSGH